MSPHGQSTKVFILYFLIISGKIFLISFVFFISEPNPDLLSFEIHKFKFFFYILIKYHFNLLV